MSNKTHGLFFISTYFIMFITGLVVLATGAMLPDILRDFDISYDMAGLLLSLQAVGNVSAVIISGFLSDLVGRKALLVAGSLMVAVGMLGLVFVPSSSVLFVLMFIAGCGWGTNNVINSAINDATGGSAKYLNRAHVFFAVGAFSAPFLVTLADNIGTGWRIAGGAIGALGVCSAALLIFIKIPAAKRAGDVPGRQKIKASLEPFKHGRYYIFMLIGFTYVAVETVMNGWITTYFQNTGILMGTQARIALSLIWVAIMLGRFTASLIGDKIKKEYITVTCSSIVLIFSVILIRVDSFMGVALCVFVLGLGLSAVFPTNLANAAPLVQGSGMATGILLSAGGFGAAVGPVITGVVAERANLLASMWVSVGFAVILVASAVINFILGKRLNKYDD